MNTGSGSHRQTRTCPRFDPTDPECAANPFPAYAALRREAPVFYNEKLDTWLVSRYDDVLSVLKQPQTYSSRSALLATGAFSSPVEDVLAHGIGMGTVLTQADEPDHTRIRSVFNRPLAAARIAGMEGDIRAIASELIDAFSSDAGVELVRRYSELLPGLVICDLLGVPREHFTWLRGWDESWVSLLSFDVPEDEQIRCAHDVISYERYVHEQFLDRQRVPRGDLLTALLPVQLGGTAPLSLGEAVYNVIDSIVGGYGTIARTITNAVAALFEHRDQYDRIRADPALLEGLLEEILRVANPVLGTFRVTTRPVRLAGTRLPTGARVFLLYASANHDESRFENPCELDADRPGVRRHLTFSDGIHHCVGSALSRLTIRVGLELLLERLPNLRPDVHATPRRLRHVLLRGYETFPVQWDPSR
jgi:cytochrome P450